MKKKNLPWNCECIVNLYDSSSNNNSDNDDGINKHSKNTGSCSGQAIQKPHVTVVVIDELQQ